MEYHISTNSASESMQFGEDLAGILNSGDVITLEGDLGAGKTTFTKGIATGLRITDTVSSPTFTMIKEYEGSLKLYHLDAYRLEFSDEDLGFDEYIYGTGVTVIEWAQYIEDYLPEDRLAITIDYLDEDRRRIHLKPYGVRYIQLVQAIKDRESKRLNS